MPEWTKSKTARYFYTEYKHKKDKKHPLYVSRNNYRGFLLDFFEMVQTHLIEGKTYYPPYGMGEFRVHKYKPTGDKKPRHHHLEKEYFKEHGVWKKIYLQNFHTNGEKVSIRWYKNNYRAIPCKIYYNFVACTKLKDRLGDKLLKDGSVEDYYKVEKNTRLKNIKTLI